VINRDVIYIKTMGITDENNKVLFPKWDLLTWMEITDEINPKLRAELLEHTGQSFCFYPGDTPKVHLLSSRLTKSSNHQFY
jgi:hypothetical protein